MQNKLLKNKSLLLLISGAFISILGSQIQDFALSLYVLKLTGSATKFASVLAVTILPQIILGPICGVFADWFDRKKLMVVLDIISGLVVGSMGIIYKINGVLPMGYIYFAVIVLSVVSLLYGASASAVIPSIVDKEQLVSANSFISGAKSIPQILGPVISGVIYGFWGLTYVVIFNSLSFFISALCEILMTIPKSQREPIKFNFKQFKLDFKEGLSFILHKKLIFRIVMCAFIINFAMDPVFSIGITYICKNILMLSDQIVGIVQSMIAVGLILGSIVGGVVGQKLDMRKVFGPIINLSALSYTAIAGILILFYNKTVTNVYITIGAIIIVLIVMVILITLINILTSTIFQQEVPTDMMGRAASVLSTICVAAMPIGQLFIGSMFDHLRAYVPILLCGAILLFAGTAFIISEKRTTTVQVNTETN